jgi:superfamily II DNA/RNA helicase
MRNPEKILVSKDEIALTQINQYYMIVNPHNKFEVYAAYCMRTALDER